MHLFFLIHIFLMLHITIVLPHTDLCSVVHISMLLHPRISTALSTHLCSSIHTPLLLHPHTSVIHAHLCSPIHTSLFSYPHPLFHLQTFGLSTTHLCSPTHITLLLHTCVSATQLKKTSAASLPTVLHHPYIYAASSTLLYYLVLTPLLPYDSLLLLPYDPLLLLPYSHTSAAIQTPLTFYSHTHPQHYRTIPLFQTQETTFLVNIDDSNPTNIALSLLDTMMSLSMERQIFFFSCEFLPPFFFLAINNSNKPFVYSWAGWFETLQGMSWLDTSSPFPRPSFEGLKGIKDQILFPKL